MKKVLLTLTLALIAGFSHAQRAIDWSVEEIVAPTQLNSAPTATSFNFDIVLKNNGPDSVFADDTFGFSIQARVKNNPNQIYFAVPNNPSDVIIRRVNKIMAPGDTMHLTGAVTAGLIANNSFIFTLRVTSIILNRSTNGITPETSTTNNILTKDMTWFNRYGWGVSVADVNTENVSVYPNPAADVVNINLNVVDPSSPFDVVITDMTGRVISTESFNSGNIQINTSDLTSGIYTVQVKNGDLISTTKISVK